MEVGWCRGLLILHFEVSKTTFVFCEDAVVISRILSYFFTLRLWDPWPIYIGESYKSKLQNREGNKKFNIGKKFLCSVILLLNTLYKNKAQVKCKDKAGQTGQQLRD